MRALKVRAWIKNKKFMAPKNGETLYSMLEWVYEAGENHWLVYSDHILMLYIDRKDQDGKEIYEGDIIKNSNTGWVFQVIWEAPAFKLKQIGNDSIFDITNTSNHIVIGNIYENPELLEKAEE